MNKQLFFFKVNSNKLNKDILTIWIAEKNISKEMFDAEIEVFQSKHKFINDDIFVFLPQDFSFDVMKSDRLNNNVRKLSLFKFTEKGEYTYQRDKFFENYKIKDDELKTELEVIKHAAMIDIFKDNNGLLELNGDYHFETLDGKHANSFVKVSNILVEKSEIDFLSICLLPFINNDLKQIYIDTSTIYSLILNTLLIKKRINPQIEIPMIYNYKSYDYKNNIFTMSDNNSLLIVSSSSSGSLASKINETYSFCATKILTIFYFNKEIIPFNSKILCNLIKDTELYDKRPIVKKASDCHMCREGSQVVKIANEKFLVEQQEPEAIRITINHQPARSLDFFKKYTNRNVLKLGGGNKFRLHIDEKSLLKIEKFKDNLDYLLSTYGNKKISMIIYTKTSKKLAKYILNNLGLKDKTLIEYEDYLKSQKKYAQDKSVLIVSSSIHSGLTIENISRHLRNTHPDSLRIYIFGILKTTSEEAYNFLRLNLVKHHMYNQDHIFLPLEKIYLPKFNSGKTVWDKELELLKRINESNEDFLSSKNEIISNRINELEKIKCNASDSCIYWNSGENADKPLKIQAGFAFLNEKILARNPTQADILYTFASVIQNAREVVKETKKVKNLKSTVHRRKVIAPNNFTRFNDSILQASILRVSYSSELNYKSSKKMSAIMKSIIYDVIKNFNNSIGESAMEFLIMLSIGHLKLHDNDLKNLLIDIEKIESLPEHFKLVISAIK